MKAASAAAILMWLLPGAGRALDSRLVFRPEAEEGSIPALPLSFGPDRPVCGRLTFDPARARSGGLIFVTDAGETGDESAIRLSRAVLARRAGVLSRAAILARRHGVPAVAIGRGDWDATAPSLTAREPVFGPAQTIAGFPVLPAVGEKDRLLREGDAACVDAAAGRLLIPSPQGADAAVEGTFVAEAFDGLLDAGALERWLAEAPSAPRSGALMAELASRALDGSIGASDLSRLETAARAAAGAGGAAYLARRQRRAWERAASSARGEMEACAAAAADAPSAEVLEGLTARAGALWDRATAAGRSYGGDGGVPAAARACLDAAARRRRTAPHVSPSFEDAAAAAGAAKVEASELPADSWDRFVSDNSLGSFLSDKASDASLGLRRKSETIQRRIREGRVGPESPLGQALSAAAAKCPCVIIGADATVKAPSERDAFGAVRDAWAASWGPGPLGARLRAGLGAKYDGRLQFARAAKADVAGLLYSRDPSSARRRVLVAAAPGALETVLDGAADFERWTLDPVSGRALEFEASAAGDKPLLSTRRLKALARLARALDAWRGGAVEVAFSFDGEKLIAHHARALETPRPLRPLTDPLRPRPAPERLGVKTVR